VMSVQALTAALALAFWKTRPAAEPEPLPV
jgi:hypothetical protein